jgi:predicted amidohydrolase
MCATRNAEENRDGLLALAQEAIDAGATYLQSPEMTNLVERERARLFAAVRMEAEDPVLQAAREFARAHRISFHLGSLAIRVGEKIANRAFLIDPEGAIVARYDKLHLFDVDLPNGESWRESATYHAGDCAVIAELGADQGEMRLGLAICYDLRFPTLFQTLATSGATLLGAPSCFTQTTGAAHWHVLQRARAIETGSFMLSAAQGGTHADGRETFGHSIIVDPWGRVLAEGGIAPGIVLAEIDPARVSEARARIPSLDAARPIRIGAIGVG